MNLAKCLKDSGLTKNEKAEFKMAALVHRSKNKGTVTQANIAVATKYINELESDIVDIGKLLVEYDKKAAPKPVKAEPKKETKPVTQEKKPSKNPQALIDEAKMEIGIINRYPKLSDNPKQEVAEWEKVIAENEALLGKGEVKYSVSEDSGGTEKDKNFKNWSKGYSVLEGNEIADAEPDQGVVVKVSHGTTEEFEIFDPTVKGTKEGQFGQVNYFTSDKGDADINYVGMGPDLTQRIENRKDSIQWEIGNALEDGTNYKQVAEEWDVAIKEIKGLGEEEIAQLIAEKELLGDDPKRLDLYVRLDKPVYIGGETTTWIDNFDSEAIREDATEQILEENNATKKDIDEYENEIQDRSNEIENEIEPEIYNAIQQALYEVETNSDITAEKVYGELEIYEGEITATELEERLRASESLMYAEDYDASGLLQSHIIGLIFKHLGYDGIVLQNANERFKNMDMGDETSHVHVFDTPTQIKSRERNVLYSPTEENIYYSTRDKPLTQKEKTDALYQTKKRNEASNKLANMGRQESLKELREALEDRGDTSSVRIVNPITRKQKTYKTIGKLFGLDVVLFKSKDAGINNINGFTYSGTNTIYVNTSSGYPLLSIIGHETMHQLKANNPELYNELSTEIFPLLKDYQAYSDKLTGVRGALGTGELTKEQIFEEFISDLSGDQFQKSEFWEKLNQKNPGIVEKLVKIITKIINKIKNISSRAGKHVSDIEKVQDAIVKAMGEFAVSTKKDKAGKKKLSTIPLADPWYSQLLKSVEGIQQKAMPATQWKQILKSSNFKQQGVKEEEIEWSGVNEWLDSKKGKVTKQEVVDYLEQNQVVIEEVVKGKEDLPFTEKQFKKYADEEDSIYQKEVLDKIKPLQEEYQQAYRDGDKEKYKTLKTKADNLKADLSVELDDAPRYAFLRDKREEWVAASNLNDQSPTKFSQFQLEGGPLSRDTEILTETGWERIDEVEIGKNVLSRKDEGGVLEWVPVEAKPTIFSKKLYHFKNRSIDMKVSPCHQMVVEKIIGGWGFNRRRELMRITAEDLWTTCGCRVPLTGTWEGTYTDLLFNKNAGDVMEFIGWFISEGWSVTSKKGHKSTFGIGQSKEKNPVKSKRLEELFDRLGFKWNYVPSGMAYYVGIKSMPKELVRLCHSQGTAKDKFIPSELFDFDIDLLKRLQESLILGDGCTSIDKKGIRKPSRNYFTTSKRLADDFQKLTLLTGNHSRITIRKKNDKQKNDLYCIGVNRINYATVDDAKYGFVDYNDTAFCVTVKNHAIYVRRNGIAAFTGNSNYKEFLLRMPALDEKIKPLTAQSFMEPIDFTPTTDFVSPHYDESNIIAHIRASERMVDGKKVLHIEEVQSDWHQEGRKKGYKDSSQDAFEQKGLVPQAPFKTKWSLLALKKMVRHGAENGFDTIAWSGGDVQFDRWGSEAFAWSKARHRSNNKPGWRIAGKEQEGGVAFEGMEQQLIDEAAYGNKWIDSKKELNGFVEGIMSRQSGEWSPENWKKHIDKVTDNIWDRMQTEDKGSTLPRKEGMAGFYDRMLPSAVNKFFNKKAWGKAKVGEIEIITKEDKPLSDMIPPKHEKTTLHSLPITPEMRSKSLKEGMPLFKTAEDLLKERTNTTNQTAEQAGSKYQGSAERGKASIENIMDTLRKTATTKSDLVKADISKEQKIIEEYRKLELLSKDPQASISTKQKMLATFLKVLPENVRAKVITPLSVISRYKQIGTHKKRIDEALSRAEKELVVYLRRNIVAGILKTSSKKKLAKNRIKKGTLGHIAERDLQFIRETLKDKNIAATLFQAESQLEKKETELEEADEVKAEIIEEEISDLQSHITIIETFGNIKSQNLEDLLFAREALSSIIMDGRASWRTEREDINKAFDKLFSTLKTKKTDKGIALFTTTEDSTPGQGISFKDIQSRFKKQFITIDPKSGAINIRFKNGLGLKIRQVRHIAGQSFQYAVESGRMSQNGVILGKYQDNEIILNENLADNFTRDHELFHFLSDNNIITKSDRILLKGKFKALKKKGQLSFKESTLENKKIAREENEANTFAQLLKEREKYRGTAVGRMLQRVIDFVNSLIYIGKLSMAKLQGKDTTTLKEDRAVMEAGIKLANEVISGKIFEREATESEVKKQVQVLNKSLSLHRKYLRLYKQVENISISEETKAKYKDTTSESPVAHPERDVPVMLSRIRDLQKAVTELDQHAYLQTSEDIKDFEDSESTFFQKASDMIIGNWKHRKDKVKGKDDLSAIAHILQSTMYNAEKIGGAYKRLWNIIRQKDDFKKIAQRNLWVEGDESLLEGLKTFTKQFKKLYNTELKPYLLQKDIEGKGFVVRQKDNGMFELLHWKKKDGKRKHIENFEDENIAWKYATRLEAKESDLSERSKEALTLFRKMSHNLYHHYAKGMQETIDAYEAAGQPIPSITSQTEDGTTKIDLYAAMKKMGDLRGHYFPRLRNSGRYKVKGTKKGVTSQMQFFDLLISAKAYRNKLEREGYRVKEIKDEGKLSEDLFQSLNPLLAQQQLLNKALESISNKDKQRILEDQNIKGEWDGDTFILKGHGLNAGTEGFVRHLGGRYKERWTANTYSPEIVFENIPENTNPDEFEAGVTKAILHSGGLEVDMDLAFAQAMVKQYDIVLKGHGARARMISRSDVKGTGVIQGYETDPLIAITQAMNAAAGSEAKSIVAKEGTAAIMGRDKSWKEFQEAQEDDAIKDLQAELDKLDITSEADKTKKKELVRELLDIRNKLAKVDNPSPDFVIKNQRKIKALKKQIKDLTRWSDIGKAQEIKKEITQAKQDIYSDYLTMVEDRMIDEKTQGRTYKEATATLKDIIKNEEFTDRVVGTLKGLAVWQYLGLRVSSAAVNVTNMGLGVPAAINGETENKVKIHKAIKFIGAGMKNYALHRAGKLSGKQKEVFDEIRERGWDDPQLNREAFDVLASKWGKGWSWALEKSMWMFGKTEEMNRAASIAAAYFSMKDVNKGEWDHEAMMQKARDISDKAHGSYGVQNRPYQMRGDNAAARVLQMSYVFQTFTHNYLQEMYRLGFDKKQYKAALYMALAPAIFGVGATVPMGVAKAISSALGGDDPEEGLINLAEDAFGGGDIARNGLMGAFDHGINLRGSLATRFGVPSTFADIFGAPGSVVSDILQGGKNITKEYYVEGFEKLAPAAISNISRGIRETTRGVTTRSGTPIFWGDKPLKSDSIDMIIRMLSFNPSNLSKKKEIQWSEYKKQTKYREIKSNIYKKLKLAYAKRSRADIIKIKADIRDFNIMIKDKNLTRIVPLITYKSIKNVLRRTKKAPKRERLRQ